MTTTYLADLQKLLPDPEVPITADTTFASLGWDSIDTVKFLWDAEERFDVEIPNREAKTFETFQDLINWLQREQD